MPRTFQKLLAILIFKAGNIWRQSKRGARQPSKRHGLNQEAEQFGFGCDAKRIMALPGNGPGFEYCEIRFVPVRESGSIFDGSGYFSARRLGANRQPLSDAWFSAEYCSPIIHTSPGSAKPPIHQCQRSGEYAVRLVDMLHQDGWKEIVATNATGTRLFRRTVAPM
jgi:hypothetical protein